MREDRGRSPLLTISALNKSYGGVRAVRNASFSVRVNAITGLIGPNGAGKSTTVDLTSGMQPPDSGTITFDGADVTRLPIDKKARAGIVRTFQHSREFSGLTVLENMLVAPLAQPGSRLLRGVLGGAAVRSREKDLVATALDLLQRFNLARYANSLAGNLSGGQKRLLEVARALMTRPKLLILDEPMSGVNPVLADQLAEQICRIVQDGVTVLLIEHNLQFVERLCPHIIVMAQGAVLAEGDMDSLRDNEQVLSAYLGTQR
ncbi:MAG: ABC transporter ATP-binding protein [Pseudonocardiales bacterium]|nr:MAG: ABC transporter ATP-binding protein [Pseudonocardiales bacterium]